MACLICGSRDCGLRPQTPLPALGDEMECEIGDLVEPHSGHPNCQTPHRAAHSPLLANILLHQLDMELERRRYRFARYADDLIILSKSKVAPMSDCAFLGFTIKGKKIRWTDKALADFKHRIKELTGTRQRKGKLRRARQLGCSAHCGLARWVVWGVTARGRCLPD